MAEVEIDLGTLTNSCFVIMPFESTYNTEYARVIKPAVEATGLACIRADEIYSKPHIMADIWKSMRAARIVIAELTGRNTNVFYEVGVAHTLGKPVIIITRNEDDVPFDLKGLRYRYYSIEDPFWGENLKKSVTEMIQKLLKEQNYGTVFEDINLTGEIKYAERKVSSTEKDGKPSHDLTGAWQGTMAEGDFSYELKLDIAQQTNSLAGTMIISFPYKQKRTVVQETMRGEIKGSVVNLYGISYSYLEQGASPEYFLDALSIQISSKDDELSGGWTDMKGHGGQVSLKRMEQKEVQEKSGD